MAGGRVTRIARSLAILGILAYPLAAAQQAPPTLEQHLKQAQIFLDQEKFADAGRELRAAIALHPQIRGAYYQLGFALFQTGDFAEAEKAFTKELEFQPPDPFSLYYLARIRLDKDQREKAVGFFERSLAAGEVLDVRQKLASCYLALDRPDQAIRLLEPSVRKRPEDGGLHYLLGRAYKQKGKAAEASIEFDAATRWKGKVRTEMQLLTQLHRALTSNNQPEALAATRELAHSGDPDILLAAATALGEAGLHREATPFLQETVRRQPNLAEAHYNLGRAYLAVGGPEKALPELQLAVDLNPAFYEAEVLLGTLLVEAGQNEAAIKHLRAAVDVRADSPRVLMMLGLQYFQERYFQNAIEVLQKAMRLDPENPDPRFLLIQAHYRYLEYERALSLAQETRDRFPDNALASFHLGAQFANFSRLPEAKEQIEIALRKDPKLFEARVALGDVLFRMGKPEESMVQFREALAGDPQLINAHAGIGKALIQLKRYPEAAAAMEQAIGLDSKLASLHLYLSQAYRALGRAEEAKKEAETFGQLNQERAKARDQEVDRKHIE